MKADVLEITLTPAFANASMISSVMPSAKASLSGSALALASGSTAMSTRRCRD